MMVLAADRTTPIGSREEAEGYVAMICFKHGPPHRHGVELEWIVHYEGDPTRPLDRNDLRTALGPHAPGTLAPGSPHLPLPRGSALTVEPGGQVEISSPADLTVPDLLEAVDSDAAAVADALTQTGLAPGTHGIDAHRPPRRLLDVPRYKAMQSAFDRVGDAGRTMMCSTASLQVCIDAGERGDVATRWRAVHAIGPAMVALFANSSRFAGRDSGWASARLRATLGTFPPYTSPPHVGASTDPAARWARLAMRAWVICRRRDGDSWDAPPGLTFGDWADGALGSRPSLDDLDYHLSTLFPPVRPRGYLEVRYLDAQPGQRWRDPALLLAALMSDPATIDRALEVTEPAVDRWFPAARDGLADLRVRKAAAAVVDVGCAAMTRLGVPDDQISLTSDALLERIADHSQRRHRP